MKTRSSSAISLVIVFLLFVPIYSIADTTINFDTDTNNVPIPDTSVINTTYDPWGVTFSCVGTCPLGNQVYAVNAPSYATSDPNVVSFLSYTPVVYNTEGVVRATFGCPEGANYVSIRAVAYYDNSAATLNAYNSGGGMIAGSTDYMTNVGDTTQLTINAADIAYVEFAGLNGPPDNYHGSVFDDLVFTCQSKAEVPTMTQWGMMTFMVLAGIGAVYHLYTKKRRRTNN